MKREIDKKTVFQGLLNKTIVALFKDCYLSEDHSHMSVYDIWVKYQSRLFRSC